MIDSVKVRRLVSILLTTILLAAQVVCCQPTFVLPDGSECKTCRQIEHEAENSQAGLAENGHGDCHDCCSLQGCDGKERQSPAKTSERLLDAAVAILPAHLEFSPQDLSLPSVRTPYEPLRRKDVLAGVVSGRAPPFFSFI